MFIHPMLEFLQQAQWSPYLVGALIGVLSWFSFLSVGKLLGVSTSFVRTVGMIEKVFIPDHAKGNPYFREEKPEIDWQWMLVLGIFIGSFLSAWISGDFSIKALPRLWERQFGPSIWFRWSMAFVGGVILMFGARLAGG
jgi:hypothetical protein